ncbi:MAG: superoxide dismutase family protein [Suilimivivens sp.]
MRDDQITPRINFISLLAYERPQAVAWVNGGTMYPRISGLVKFYQTSYGGVLVEAEIFNLPDIDTPGSSDFYAMHIHETGSCSDHFMNTGGHYNPGNTLHPEHAGDMIPLLANQGYAYTVFYDKRFTIPDITGRAVIIHAKPDDFTTQSAGNSGDRIACGVIKKVL